MRTPSRFRTEISKPKAAGRSPAGLVLLVEDDDHISERVEACLVGLGYFVAHRLTCQEHACEILGTLIPDGGVLDLKCGLPAVTATAHRLDELAVPFVILVGPEPVEFNDPVLMRAPTIPRSFVEKDLVALMKKVLEIKNVVPEAGVASH
jgi:hypothetical protein